MKLRNKKTGEIRNVETFGDNFLIGAKDYPNDTTIVINSLAELNGEWEDYEEPKEYWFIGEDGNPHTVPSEHYIFIERIKQIGNHFETKEETEKAVEKLKAITRLEDKGFRFDGYDVANRAGDNVICGQVYFKAGNYDREEIKNYLDLLFGGEE